ncbi:MAG: M23 family metallopeptidase [Clostridia bacterium]|nr:M23 family metallopeptidase [Clostridia bacterium]
MYKRKHYGWISFLSFIFLLSANLYMAYSLTQKNFSETETVFHNTIQTENSDAQKNVLFILPVQNCALSSPFGTREGAEHTGIDLAADSDTPVLAASSGNVRLSDWVEGYGYTIILTHQDGFETLYAHCNSLLVEAGATVQQGQEIAKVGSTGNSTGPHLHFEIIKDGVYQDPALYITLPVS